METEFKKLSGVSLITGSVLMVATMVLHPSGGNVEHILNIKKILVISHSLAIFSLSFIGFGFWGLSNALLTKSRVSVLAFIISCFGLVAAMIAATVNGLTLPMFLAHVDTVTANSEVVKLIRFYGASLNVPMDYILLSSMALSISIWSVLIIRSRQLPVWIGYYGLILILAGLAAAFSRFNMVHLSGFRMVIFGIVSWMIVVGVRVLMNNNMNDGDR